MSKLVVNEGESVQNVGCGILHSFADFGSTCRWTGKSYYIAGAGLHIPMFDKDPYSNILVPSFHFCDRGL